MPPGLALSAGATLDELRRSPLVIVCRSTTAVPVLSWTANSARESLRSQRSGLALVRQGIGIRNVAGINGANIAKNLGRRARVGIHAQRIDCAAETAAGHPRPSSPYVERTSCGSIATVFSSPPPIR